MDSLVAAALHDAKNALGVLEAWLDQAKQQAPTPALDQARATAQRINTQLVELLAIYRQEQGTLRMTVADQDLANFLDDLRADWVLPPDSQLQVEWDKEDNAGRLGAWAFDGYLVKFVLLDALRNAQRQARSRISLSLERDDEGCLRFTVADDGPGFDADHEAAAMAESSSGLGLTFARVIAERHRNLKGQCGRLEIKNAPEGGALFSLVLP